MRTYVLAVAKGHHKMFIQSIESVGRVTYTPLRSKAKQFKLNEAKSLAERIDAIIEVGGKGR